MKTKITRLLHPFKLLLMAACLIVLACSEKTQIYTQIVPQDPPPGTPKVKPASQGPSGNDQAASPSKQGSEILTWALPQGWRESKANPPRIANLIVGEGENELTFAVTRFPGTVGGITANINRWRGQIKLDPITEEEIDNLMREGAIKAFEAPLPLVFMHFQSETEGLLAAIIPDSRQANTWFIKTIDDKAKTQKHVATFETLLTTGLSFEPGVSGSAPSGQSGQAGNTQAAPPSPDEFAQSLPSAPLSEYIWQRPDQWTESPASQFITAGYTYEKEDQSVKLTLSRLSGRGGDIKANIDRWRGQIGMPPASDEDARALLNVPEPYQIAGGMGLFIALENPENQKKTSVIIIPRRNETWYIKLTGDTALVNETKPAMISFAGSIKKK